MENLIEKLLPQNIEVEKSLLGSILIDSDSLLKIADTIDPKDFYNAEHQHIYSTMLKLHNARSPIDLITIKNELKGVSNSYLVSLINCVPSALHIEEYAKIVKDCSLRRQMLDALRESEKTAYDEKIDINDVISKAQNSIFAINTFKTQDDSPRGIIGKINKIQEEYKEKYAKGQYLLGYDCGFDKINYLIDGFRGGHLWIVAGWSNTGKSFMALNMVEKVLEQNVPVSFFSLEMNQEDLFARLVGLRFNMSSTRVIKGIYWDFEKETWVKDDPALVKEIKEEIDSMVDLPLEIHTTHFEIEKIKALIRKDVATRGVKVVAIDYLQNIRSDKYNKEYERINESVGDLFKLAEELNITIVLLSQINNESEKGMGAGAGLKGSGNIESTSSITIKIKKVKNQVGLYDENKPVSPIEIRVEKNRHGPTATAEGYFFYRYSGVYSKFGDIPEGVKRFNEDEIKKFEQEI